MNPGEPERPLRILCVVNLAWDARLGASRVWIALSEHWRSAGHTVEKFCITDAFPRPARSRAQVALRQALFPRYAEKFIRENSHRFDVIDALIGTVPLDRQQLGFGGLLVARSVGLPLAYNRFLEASLARWPDQPRGRFLGRILYRWTAHRLRRNADLALSRCDLLNLPSETERALIAQTPARTKPCVIHPYGLNEGERRNFQSAAQPATVRRAAKTICFIGMWILRKGSRDWAGIIRAIRAAEPAARFKFLGTMTDSDAVFRDLAPGDRAVVSCLETFAPEDLPQLLADCAVGVFPSYVEGFGLAVLEQLAAGIPTVAYDAPGPREILEPLRDLLLVPPGDVQAVADRVVKVLRQSEGADEELRAKCIARATEYSWARIAPANIHSYRLYLSGATGPIIFTQPFGLRAPGGGPRILRAILEDAPLPLQLVCTAPESPPPQKSLAEIHLPLRPSFGRLERSRFAGTAWAVAPIFARQFLRRLEAFCAEKNARALHAIAHGGLDFYHAFQTARKLTIPFLLHVHDDFIYSSRARRGGEDANAAIAEAWQNAAVRFVIGRALGEEYCRRYGKADYTIITDGLTSIAHSARRPAPGRLRIYFMGLFHLEYEANLRALLVAMEQLRSEVTGLSITLRCGAIRPGIIDRAQEFVRVLPFGSEGDVARDLEQADLLYLPLPFDPAHAPLARYSLSTKLVTYLGSGIPILYHGPQESAVCQLLSENNAALLCQNPEAPAVATALRQFANDGQSGVAAASHALRLAREQFSLPEIRRRFWDAIEHALGQ